ncbi:MAG: GlsB/YeaQ/YmgE family stress response membrane protein [Acidimicrobiia bacterium]|nr:GlsB/YeaQ/YmgE family stress response membrane protein [Acidimicrobiia bacterium]
MLILGILGFGMLVGGTAQWILGRNGWKIDWGMALVAGLVGSFVGGLIVSLLAGDGLALQPSGLIGSFVGAMIVTAIWLWFNENKRAEAKADRRR